MQVTVKQIASLISGYEWVRVFFDSEHFFDFDNDEMLPALFGDFLVDNLSTLKDKDSSLAGIQINIRMKHEPVKATA